VAHVALKLPLTGGSFFVFIKSEFSFAERVYWLYHPLTKTNRQALELLAQQLVAGVSRNEQWQSDFLNKKRGAKYNESMSCVSATVTTRLSPMKLLAVSMPVELLPMMTTYLASLAAASKALASGWVRGVYTPPRWWPGSLGRRLGVLPRASSNWS